MSKEPKLRDGLVKPEWIKQYRNLTNCRARKGMKPIIRTREALAMCDVRRARRLDPKHPLVRMTPERQSSFFWPTKVLR